MRLALLSLGLLLGGCGGSTGAAATTTVGAGGAGGTSSTSSAGGAGGLGGADAKDAGADGAGAGGGGGAHDTKFGIHVVLQTTSVADTVAETKAYCAGYTRTGVQLSNWPHPTNEYDAYVAAGIRVLLNLTWQSAAGGPVPFPTDLQAYGAKVAAVLDTITPPELVVIENEEINTNFHSGPISDYVAMLEAASPIVHAHGLKLTNGGVYGGGLYTLVYRYLDGKYGTTAADAFGNVVFQPAGLKAVKNKSNATLEALAAEVQAALDTAPYLDYINIHHYEVDNPNITDTPSVTTTNPNVIKLIKEFVETTTGKPIMCNETSIRDGNTQPALVTALLQDYADNGYPYVIWWDNIDGNKYDGSPLNDGTPPYALRPNGEAFKSFLMSYDGKCP